MKVVIVRRVRGSTPSIDIYTDNLVAGIKTVRPEWNVVEVEPKPWNSPDKLWMSGTGVRKYRECYWQYPRQVSQMSADIFHIVDHTDAHIARWLHRAGKSVVVTCHDLVQLIQPEQQSRFPALSLAVWRYSVKSMSVADRIIAVSTNTARDIERLLNVPSRQISVALNGVEPQFRVLPRHSVELFRQQHSISDTGLCLLHVGGTHQRKNILTVLKVLAQLKTRGTSASLWKIGDKFSAEHLDLIERERLTERIIHWGNPDKETLVQIYNAADVLLSPSLYEGFGLTIVEAMACGIPVISSNVSSLPEVGGDAAVLVDPMNVEAMVTAIYRIADECEYRQDLIAKGLARSKLFSWKDTASKVSNIYERVLER